jgi:hypothetical protein
VLETFRSPTIFSSNILSYTEKRDEDGYQQARVRYLIFDEGEYDARPSPNVNSSPDLQDVNALQKKFYVGQYYVDGAEKKAGSLPNTISCRDLCCPVQMTAITKKAGKHGNKTVMFSCTRIVVNNFPKVAAWAARFADEMLEEDDDETPFSRGELALARDTGMLHTAGGVDNQLRQRSSM